MVLYGGSDGEIDRKCYAEGYKNGVTCGCKQYVQKQTAHTKNIDETCTYTVYSNMKQRPEQSVSTRVRCTPRETYIYIILYIGTWCINTFYNAFHAFMIVSTLVWIINISIYIYRMFHRVRLQYVSFFWIVTVYYKSNHRVLQPMSCKKWVKRCKKCTWSGSRKLRMTTVGPACYDSFWDYVRTYVLRIFL